MRYFLHLAYKGADYHGWQRQPNAHSVQQTLEESLSTVLRREIAVVGAGRTDAGVNARCMYAHFDLDEKLQDISRICLSLNRLCGKDIAVYDIFPVSPEAHARFDAVSRTYKYFVATQKSPFLYPLTWKATCRLDYDKMNQAAAILLQTEDFTSFAKLHSDAKTNICKVTEARWERVYDSDIMAFTITADRFLRNMVRAVVGTLVDVGRGKLSIEGFREIIDKKNRCSAGTSMPPQALYLWDVKYPDAIFNTI